MVMEAAVVAVVMGTPMAEAQAEVAGWQGRPAGTLEGTAAEATKVVASVAAMAGGGEVVTAAAGVEGAAAAGEEEAEVVEWSGRPEGLLGGSLAAATMAARAMVAAARVMAAMVAARAKVAAARVVAAVVAAVQVGTGGAWVA